MAVVTETVSLTTWTPPAADEPEIVVDVEVDASEVESEALGASGSESAERMVAAGAPASEPVEAPAPALQEEGARGDEVAHDDRAVVGEVVEAASPPAADAGPVEADEVAAAEPTGGEERPPASSRRPVAMPADEQISQIAFGAAELEPPRHTPPPESGRLPAPAADDFEEDATGIHPAVAEETGRKVVSQLVAEATRAELPPMEHVADVIGNAQRFAPATFLAWLDAALKLGDDA